MHAEPIVIQRRLPEHLRPAAVELFEEAFGEKTRMAVPEREKRMAFMSRVYDAEHVIVATRGDTLLGMAGLRARTGHYRGGLIDVGWDPRPYRDLLGWWGAVRATWGSRMADHRPAAGELYIDGIAVSPEARGHGVGTRLLEEIATIAREQGMRWVRLDVIDTNPRAKALYERVGYTVTRVQSFRFIERWVGFGGLISMELPIGSEDAESRPGDRATGEAS